MPASKRRKQRIAQNQRQIEKARKRLEIQEQKENVQPPMHTPNHVMVSNDTPQVCERTINERELDITKNSVLVQAEENTEERDQETENDDSNGRWWYWDSIYNGISQSVEVAKDMVFPSRVLKRQLDDAQKKLRLMEEQLEAIHNQEDKDKRRRKRARQLMDPDPVSPLVLPPPPPPPPICFQPRIIMTRRKTKILKEDIISNQPVITLDHIRNVKLRNVSQDDSRKGIKRARRNSTEGFVVSLADLKSVKLNKACQRRQSLQPRRFSPQKPEFSLVRNSLRRIGSQNNSCDTKQEDIETGEGVTPMLARALRRKFEAAYPLSPLQSPTSPQSPVSPFPISPPPPSISTTVPPSPPPNSIETSEVFSPRVVLEVREV